MLPAAHFYSFTRKAATAVAGFWRLQLLQPQRFNPPTHLVQVSAQLLSDDAAHIGQHLSLVLQAGWQQALLGEGPTKAQHMLSEACGPSQTHGSGVHDHALSAHGAGSLGLQRGRRIARVSLG